LTKSEQESAGPQGFTLLPAPSSQRSLKKKHPFASV
jgi:hypothetical protein